MSILSNLILPVKNTSTGVISSEEFTIPGTFLGTCETAASAKEKVATVGSTFELFIGARVGIKFTNTNSATCYQNNPITLNVNETGAYPIYYDKILSVSKESNAFGRSGGYIFYIFDGTYWVVDSTAMDKDTTYSTLTVEELTSGTNTNNRVVKGSLLKEGIESLISTAIEALGLSTVATSGSYTDLDDTPTLAAVATTGSYNDLEDKPTITPPYVKELTANAAANATSVTFTDAAITADATLDVYTPVFTNLTGMSISGTTLTVSFKAVSSAMTVKLRIS